METQLDIPNPPGNRTHKSDPAETLCADLEKLEKQYTKDKSVTGSEMG